MNAGTKYLFVWSNTKDVLYLYFTRDIRIWYSDNIHPVTTMGNMLLPLLSHSKLSLILVGLGFPFYKSFKKNLDKL